ncbi:hypothetical protein [Promicromonospora sp. NPDC060271]|uniref:hypothetical protein n=1 Tax=Promicromonospora sp. NPDC060271 TaxID=3347089 RepID=UPI00365AC210
MALSVVGSNGSVTLVGTVPDWITAIATVAAVVFAYFAARAAGHQLTVLRQEAAARAREGRMSQARLVYWTEEGPKTGRFGFRLVNASAEPLVDAVVHITAPKESKLFADGVVKCFLGGLPPTGPEGVAFDHVAEQMNKVVDKLALKRSESDPNLLYGGHPFRVDLIFKDVGGRQWHRRQDMSLTEVMPGAVPHIDSFEQAQSRRH